MPRKIGVGIDIDNNSIRILKATVNNNNVQIADALEFPLSGIVDENLSDHTALSFKQFLQEHKFKVRKAVVGVTGEHINSRYIKLPPSCQPWRMAKIAEMDMDEIIEKSGSSLAYDYMTLPLPTKDPMMLIVMIRNSYLNRLTEFFRKAGISVQYFVPNALAMYNTFIKFCEMPSKGTVYLAEIGMADINLAIVHSGDLYFIRNLNIVSDVTKQQKPKEEEEEKRGLSDSYDLMQLDLESESACEIDETVSSTGIKDLISESMPNREIPDILEASVKFAQIQIGLTGIKIHHAFTSGFASSQPGLLKKIKSRMGCEVSPLAPFPFENTDAAIVKESPEKFTTALGLAHKHANTISAPIQIISDQKRAHNLLIRQHLFEYVSVVVAILLISFSIIFSLSTEYYYEAQVQQLEKKHKQYQERSVAIKDMLAKYKKNKEKWNFLHSQIHPNKAFLETLSYIHKQLPSTVYLIDLKFSGSVPPVIVIKGIVEESFSDVYTILKGFKKSLLQAPMIAKCEDKDPKLDEERGRLEFEFMLTLK